jgi:outer membrane receptor for ferrienterochelin and colicins
MKAFYNHKQDAYFGLRNYQADELSLYANLVYQWYSEDDVHKISSGGSFFYDKIDESIDDIYSDTLYTIEEKIPGIFMEYTFKKENLPTILLGMRADMHNEYGLFYTPRMHLKY